MSPDRSSGRRRGLSGWSRVRRCAAVLVLACAPLVEGVSAAEPGTLSGVNVRLVDEVWRLDAAADIRLTPPVHRALDNGVALTFVWQIEIQRARRWWLDAEVAKLSQRYTLAYHALSRQYVVTNRNTGKRRSFTRLASALDAIGTLVGYPVIDQVVLDDPARCTGYTRVLLEHRSLPLPLRPEALWSSAWELESAWRSWSFE